MIADSARRHGIADADTLHAYRNPVDAYDAEEGMTMLIGADRAGRMLEVGVVFADDGLDVIVHSTPLRPKYTR